jgi:hypothetical protein
MKLQTKTYYSRMLDDVVTYNVIPMDKVDFARAVFRESLKKSDTKFKLRTFYLGPRLGSNRTTKRVDGRYAKIAVYNVNHNGHKSLVDYL